ncbi:MAG: T9SS type A sorting domain-containing protein [Bacteroidota bacterium]
MKKQILLTIVVAGFISTASFSQPWLQDRALTNPDGTAVSFYEYRDAFNAYFETHDQGKGTGYKQYLRYLAFMEPRVYPSGSFPEDALWKASRQKESARLKSETPVADWKLLGPVAVPTDFGGTGPAGSGRVNCIAFHPTDPNIFYVGAPSGGVWKTTDGGLSWATTTDQLPALGVSDIGINPLNPSVLYVVTGDKDGGNTCPTYSYGILKSTDAGATWQPTGLGHETASQYRMRRILVNPVNPDIIIAAGGPGLFRSVDAGVTWTRIQTGDYYDLEFKPDDPSVVYACSGSVIYKSTNAGFSFTQSTTGLPDTGVGRTEMAVTRANANVVYAIMSNSDSGMKGIYKSSDAGVTWTPKATEETINIFSYAMDGSGDTGIAWYAIALAIDQQNEDIVYSGSVNHWISQDGGVTWSMAAHWYGGGGKPYVHADIHNLSVNPLNNICYSGNDGGLYKTADKGVTWTDLSAGLSILQIYRMAVSVSNPEIIIEGSQDNGTYMLNDGQWNSIYGGDGMECAVDPVNPQILYATTQNGNLLKSTNGGHGWTSIKPEDKGAWITPFQISGLNRNVMVAGYTCVNLTTTYGVSWRKISGTLAGGSYLNEIAIAPSDNNYIYTSSGSSIWGTKDLGENWNDLSNGLPGLYIEGIFVAPSEPEKVWVTLSGYTDGSKVFYSDNAGGSWTSYSEGLPNVPVNCMVINKLSNYAMYAGTDLGVYYRNPSMDEWIPFDDGLPNVIVNELDINYKINKIRAATFGRGIWESPIRDDGNWPPALLLTAYEQSSQIDLSWIAPAERVPDHYNIYRDSVLHATSVTNTYTDPVTTGMNYTYQVTAVYDDGESTPTNSLNARGIVTVSIPYTQDFETEAHGWLIGEKPSAWNWGNATSLQMTQLGMGNFIGINSVIAGQAGTHAQGYAVLPMMDLSGQTNLVLTCKYALRRWQDVDHLYLTCRTADEPAWTTLAEVARYDRSWTWRTFTYAIPDSLMTDGLEFAFYYTDKGTLGYGAALDNLSIAKDVSGNEEVVNRQDITLYPNPTSGTFSLGFTGFSGEQVRIEVVEATGRIILQKELRSVAAGTREEVSIRELADGTYFVRMICGERIWIKPVIKK